MKRFMVVLIIVSLPNVLLSQSIFLNKGKSAPVFNAGTAAAKNITSYALNIGYSVNGILDIGVGAARSNFSDNSLRSDLNSTDFILFTKVFALKEMEKMPISLSFDGS